MTPTDQERSNPDFGVKELLFIFFRHKGMLLLCSFLGLAAAVIAYFFAPRNYESTAKLFVRYIVERSGVDPVDPQIKTAGNQADAVINSEVEILTSLDLAGQVVDVLGSERFVPGSGKVEGKTEAVRGIAKNLNAVALKGSNIITIGYKNRDPELARAVLEELVQRYFDKHLEVHRSLGAFDFVNAQTSKVGKQLRQTEDKLEELKVSAGILSLTDSIANVNARVAKGEEELLVAETELAGQQARLQSIDSARKTPEAADAKAEGRDADSSLAAMNSGDIQRYQLLGEHIAELSKEEFELLAKFTPTSKRVQTVRDQIENLKRERRDLEAKFPLFLTTAAKTSSNGIAPIDLVTERSNLAAVTAKVETLKAQLKSAKEFATVLARVGPQITELERIKEVEETNFKYFESSLEKASLDVALDPAKMPNISVIQKPSPGMKVAGETKKLVLGIAAGGVGIGVGLALLIELLLNRSVRRPMELETRLQIPQLLAIPYLPNRSRLQLGGGENRRGSDSQNAVRGASPSMVPWNVDPMIRPFAEEIRDRLLLSFKLRNLSHKPKLVGIAGLAGREGASTIAGSLAVVLSETGDGKVLLVDMNSAHSEAHPFFDGKPSLGLADALNANGTLPSVADNLYLATGVSENGGSMQLAGKRFYSLIPNLKASHFDYIIFDLPPVNVGSATLAIAGCLDILLFVVEAEKSDRDEVKRAYMELVAAKAEVSCILNKTRTSGPKWLNA